MRTAIKQNLRTGKSNNQPGSTSTSRLLQNLSNGGEMPITLLASYGLVLGEDIERTFGIENVTVEVTNMPNKELDEGKKLMKGRIHLDGIKKPISFDFESNPAKGKEQLYKKISDVVGKKKQCETKTKVQTTQSTSGEINNKQEEKITGQKYVDKDNNEWIRFSNGHSVNTNHIGTTDVERLPDVLFVWGDNMEGIGYGGQAGVFRDKKNAVGIPTLRTPNQMKYFSDADYSKVMPEINKRFATLREHVKQGKPVVFCQNGVGTGIAKLDQKAPKIFNAIQTHIQSLKKYIAEKKIITKD